MTAPHSSDGEPLLRYLLLASLLHGLLLFWLTIRMPSTVSTPPPTLQLMLAPRAKPAESRPARSAESSSATVSSSAVSALHPPKARQQIGVNPPQLKALPTITTEALMESAHRQVQEESRQRTSGLFAASPATSAEPPASPLAKAMARRSRSEKMLGGGILQITTHAGTIYCLQAPPRSGDGSLNEALAVPTTCP